MKLPVLPTALFLSLALNLFLVGVMAGSWREMRGVVPPAMAPGPPLQVSAEPASTPSAPEAGDPPEPPPPAEPRRPSPAPAAQPVVAVRAKPSPPGPAIPAAGPLAAGQGGFPDGRPQQGPGGPRPPGVSPLMLASRDLPEREGMALRALLRAESDAVRADLFQARRDRAEAWRALARGEVSEAEANRRLDMSRRRELAARSRVENAVAEWALRQSPEVRARIGEALAEEAQPRGRRPVRPFPPGERRPPGPQDLEAGN